MGHAPPVLTRIAAELGFVAIRLPEAAAGDDVIVDALIDASAEFGDIADAVREARADGTVDQFDRGRIVVQIDEAIQKLMTLRSVVAADEGKA